MTWFSLPSMRDDKPPTFADQAGCAEWLSSQPLTNAPLMQQTLADELDALNGWPIAPRERFKILETMREAIFACETESIKRYEYRPLPLTPVEQKALDLSCRIWRGMATGYLHSLRAALDGDASVEKHAAKICHRALTALRLEQLSRYHGGSAVPDAWWRLLHATLAATEQLGVAGAPTTDRLLAETRESTPAAQYAMAVLLHLARPHELSRSQLAAARRWLARWREQATVHWTAPAHSARSLLIDLDSERPLHTASTTPNIPRWITIDSVLGKLESRIAGLRAGRSPEELKLGAGLPTDACIALLQYLHGALQRPPPPISGQYHAKRGVGVCASVDTIHRLLGGKPLRTEPEPTSISNRRFHEQIAIFGHAGHLECATPPLKLEEWQLVDETGGELGLLRAKGSEGGRLSARSLIALSDPERESPALAIVRSVMTLDDGSLYMSARGLPGVAQAIDLSGREKQSNREVQLVGIYLPAVGREDKPASLFVADGTMNKLAHLDAPDLPDGRNVGALLEHGANFERLRCE